MAFRIQDLKEGWRDQRATHSVKLDRKDLMQVLDPIPKGMQILDQEEREVVLEIQEVANQLAGTWVRPELVPVQDLAVLELAVDE